MITVTVPLMIMSYDHAPSPIEQAARILRRTSVGPSRRSTPAILPGRPVPAAEPLSVLWRLTD
jgi:hypothetical protein